MKPDSLQEFDEFRRNSADLGCAPYIINTHPNGFRCGEAAIIIGVTIANEDHPRPCYSVEYADNYKDFIAIDDYKNYKIVMPYEIRKSYIILKES